MIIFDLTIALHIVLHVVSEIISEQQQSDIAVVSRLSSRDPVTLSLLYQTPAHTQEEEVLKEETIYRNVIMNLETKKLDFRFHLKN